MALKDDLQKSWRADTPVTSTVGQDVQVRQVHVSLFPTPVVHIGVCTGTIQKDGTMVSALTQTIPVPLGKASTASEPTLEKAVADLVAAAYAVLNELQAIPNGKR